MSPGLHRGTLHAALLRKAKYEVLSVADGIVVAASEDT